MNKTIQTLVATVIAAVVAMASFTQLCLALARTNPLPQSQAQQTEQQAEQTEQAEQTDQAAQTGEQAPAEGDEAQQPAAEAAPAEEQVDREQFVTTWAERIDAFNEGYPLAGYGRTFAEAAYDNHVDPRLSPAIARVESQSGMVCYHAYNAWGWGDTEWPNWNEAIRAHVKGLAEGYGYDITPEGAASYAEGDTDAWLEQVESFKNEIWESDTL